MITCQYKEISLNISNSDICVNEYKYKAGICVNEYKKDGHLCKRREHEDDRKIDCHLIMDNEFETTKYSKSNVNPLWHLAVVLHRHILVVVLGILSHMTVGKGIF